MVLGKTVQDRQRPSHTERERNRERENKVRSGLEHAPLNHSEIQRIVREYSENLYFTNLEKLKEMEKIPRHKWPTKIK